MAAAAAGAGNNSNMKKKLVISHIHVWDKKNKGDVAIVNAVQELIRKHFPGAKISDFPVEVLKNGPKRMIAQINKTDLLIIGGGGIFYRHFTPFNKNIINAIKVPYAIVGVGVIQEFHTKPLTKKEKDSIIFLADRAKFVSVRENQTKKFLISWGAKKHIEVIGDPAVLLGEKRPKKFLVKKGFNLGLNIHYAGWMGFGQYEDRILRAYEAVAKKLTGNKKVNLYYLMHHPDERKIKNKLRLKKLELVNLSPAEQKYIYGKMDLVIGMMLHSCVMTFGAGAPFINVAYDIRNLSFTGFINHPELIAIPQNLTSLNLVTQAKQVLQNSRRLKKSFSDEKRLILNKHNKFFHKIQKLV